MNGRTIYASVDLELTGFDPAIDEIVEIGIVLFEIESGKMVVVEEWQSLVRPNGSLHARIQGLTGITELDLESAPTKEMVFSEVQRLLHGTILVGHGVNLDRRFLEAFGIETNPSVIDTLELAQIFLPTYHSYNLENLSHALSVAHTTAHRALSDAQATVGVLRALVAIYWSLSENIRSRVLIIAQRRIFAWATLFVNAFSEEQAGFSPSTRVQSGQVEASADRVPHRDRLPALISVDYACAAPWGTLSQDRESWVVALSNREQVLEAARKGYATPFLGIAEAVSAEAIARAEEMVENLLDREVLALLKILVWQEGQVTEAPLLAEINWSLLGTDYKKRFSEVRPFPQVTGVVVVDYRSLASVPTGRSVWICETDKYLEWLELQSGHTLSWQGAIHQFRQIYNPENGFGDISKAFELQEAIAATDIFFATVLLLLKKHHGMVHGVLAQSGLAPFVLARLTQAGRNYAKRLQRLSGLLADKNFTRTLHSIELFFDSVIPTDELRWIEIADGRCVFVSRPLALDGTQELILGRSRRVIYSTDLQDPTCLTYLAQRVGAGVAPALPYSNLNTNTASPFQVSFFKTESGRDASLLEDSSGAAVYLIFPNQPALKSYYDRQYVHFPDKQSVIAVGVHGGVNKVLRNFSFSTKSIVLVTQHALASFGVMRLEAHKLVYIGLPFVDMSHPFVAALGRKFFVTDREARTVFQALSIAQSLRPFGPAVQRPEVMLAILEEDHSESQDLLEALLGIKV